MPADLTMAPDDSHIPPELREFFNNQREAVIAQAREALLALAREALLARARELFGDLPTDAPPAQSPPPDAPTQPTQSDPEHD